MSTRCQVQVNERYVDHHNKEQISSSVTLYHHTNGYPSYMIPKLKEAFKATGGDWKAGRAGKSASFMCFVDPGVFEPEEGHALHGDIEYYYRVFCHNGRGDKAFWEVEIYGGNGVLFLERTRLENIPSDFA